jgi:PAS domain S-box-containing protein
MPFLIEGTLMSGPPEPTPTYSELLSRIAELEQKLLAAGRADNAHVKTEAGLRDALAYVTSIVDTVREPMLVLDSALHVQSASHSFYETFAASPDNTEGKFVYELGNSEWNIPALRSLLEEVLSQQKSLRDFEVVHEFPSLGRRVMLLNARKLWREGNDIEFLLLAIEDVTEKKRMQDELVRSNEDLQRFAYVAAHDLRSPVRAALNLSTLLVRRIEKTVSEEDMRLLTMMIANLERVTELMQDILTFSEMGNAPQQRTIVRLEEPLHIAIENLQHHIINAGADVSSGELPTVAADRTQMMMVFQNLIGNAIKYRRGEPLRIRIDAVRNGSDWQVSVSDNGQGFDPQYATKVFEPFKRLHGPNVPGSGIGLATCKRIIERLSGRIWADSTPGEGSTFYFTLPITPAET